MRNGSWLLSCALVWAVGLGCAPSTPGTGDHADAAPPAGDDADGDGISDVDEGRAAALDSDGDGTPDFRDSDSDGDGVADALEAGDDRLDTRPVDSDGDGTPDFRDTDSDGNGRLDGVDGSEDTDGDGRRDFADLDDDGDNLSDVIELGADPGAPVDTDGDGSADFRDRDSDGDTIADADELMTDADHDQLPAYRDTDSDGDCRPDALEAGDADLATPPVDTDGDGGGDFIDVDSDNDGLLDALEDPDCDGVLDPGESSAVSSDTDGDGAPDMIEHAAGTDPNDAASNPQANGDFVFLVPYQAPPTPARDTLDFATDISQADVSFLLDTTLSMGNQISAIKGSLGTMVGQLSTEIPNIGVGVAGYEDFPFPDYGNPGDRPFYLLHRVQTVRTAAGLASVQNGVNQYTLGNGGDVPEAGWEAIFQIASGLGLTGVMNATIPAFNPATAPPGATPVAGEEFGTLGGAGFRVGSLPIVVWITDASSHNSTVTGNGYIHTGSAGTNGAEAALAAKGARVIGVAARGGSFASARTDLVHAVVATGAVVTPSAWPAVGAGRPAGCSAVQCCTGQNGAGQPPVTTTNTCPLVFEVDANGTGLGAQIVQAIKVLVSGIPIDITARPVDDPSDTVDAVAAFVQEVKANPAGGPPCSGGLHAIDTDGDGVTDTFQAVLPGARACFDVVPRQNETVEPLTTPQMFKATIVVTGDGVTTLDTRDVYFLVPPVIPVPPVN
jgi:hypothetical protein